MAKYIEQLSTFATQIDNSSGMRWVTSYYLSRDDEVEIPDDAGEVKYYYLISNYGYITLYKEAVETEEDTAEKEKKEICGKQNTMRLMKSRKEHLTSGKNS